MTNVRKVTLSLPAELAANIEDRQADSGESRSAAVADLCWRGWWQWDEERRTSQSDAAYTALPESDEEQAWARAAADTMAGWDRWDGPEARTVIDEEREETLAQVRRLAAEPGASAFRAALRATLEEPPAARAAG
ncbi:MAG: hypothetical protein ACR2G7_09875 [Acidimicrobiales bacterium]